MSTPHSATPESSLTTHDSTLQTAQDYINTQLQLEVEAREVLPYVRNPPNKSSRDKAFDTCSKPLGPLRQLVFACMTCTPDGSEPAGICYSCSISCHGSHGELVELFSKRNFECDCGTTRMPKAYCDLRKGRNDVAAPHNSYNQNFRNFFCEAEPYDHDQERGTMYQCLLGDVCGEDWFHDRCILGKATQRVELPAEDKSEVDGKQMLDQEDEDTPNLQGFPDEDEFEHFICWKCVNNNTWLLDYLGTPGFLEPVVRGNDKKSAMAEENHDNISLSRKRKVSVSFDSYEAGLETRENQKQRTLDSQNDTKAPSPTRPLSGEEGSCTRPKRAKHQLVGQQVSIFLKSEFRSSLCRCKACQDILRKYPHLLEEEETYEPPLDDDATDTASLFDAGEKALGSIDRVRAIEGVMAYNMLKQKVRDFLQPFAEENRIVSSEDVIKYFEDLKGSATAQKGQRPVNDPNDESNHGPRDQKGPDSGQKGDHSPFL